MNSTLAAFPYAAKSSSLGLHNPARVHKEIEKLYAFRRINLFSQHQS